MMLAFRAYPLRPERVAMPGKNEGLPGICRAPFRRAATPTNLRPQGSSIRAAPLRESRAPTFPLTASRIRLQDSLSS